ncbi:MAG: cytochrome c3 family protein, partial [Polyangiaceae bacterium]
MKRLVAKSPLGWLLFLVLLCAGSLALAADPPNAGPPHGLTPLPNDANVPLKWLPPGAFEPDNGPSDVIYPQQTVTLRFNHKLHLGQKLTCRTCHAAAYTSASAQDELVPKGTTCDACHGSDHSNLAAVKAGSDAMGKCGFCHQGYKDGDGNAVAR